MPLLFWLDVAAYAVSVLTGLTVILAVLGAGPARRVNLFLALFAMAETGWALLALLLRLTLWLGVGNPQFLLELSTICFALTAPALTCFTVRYLDLSTRWADRVALLEVMLLLVFTVPLFHHQIVLDPSVSPAGTTDHRFTPLGVLLALIFFLSLLWPLLLFWRERSRTGERFMAWSLFSFLSGLVVGGIFNPPIPIMSFTTTISVALLGYAVINRQIFNPLRELTTQLERKVEERTRELAERTAQLEALREIGLELTAELDPDALLRAVVSRAIELLKGTAGGIYLCRPEREVLERVVSVGSYGPPIGSTLRRGEGLSGRVWETEKPLIIEDYRHWEGRAPMYEDFAPACVVGAPIRWGEQFLGVLTVSRLEEHLCPFSPSDAELLSLFATQAAVAITNARLYEDAQERAKEQEALSRIARALNSLDFREAFPALVEGLQALVGCDRISIALLERTGEHFSITTLYPPSPTLKEGTVMPLAATHAVSDLRAGRPHLTPDLEAEADLPTEQALYQAGLRSRINLPLRVGDRVVGALSLASRQPGAFWEGRLQALTQIADMLAISVENYRLLRAEREQRELAEALAEAVAAVGSTLELDQVLDRILEQAERVVPGDAFNIMMLEDGEARVVRWRGYDRWGIEDRIASLSFPLDRFPNLARRVAAGRAEVIPDTAANPEWVTLEGEEWLRSLVSAPIRIGQQVVGLLNVDGTRSGQFGPADAHRLQAFADQAALAIENARLYEELQHRAEKLEERVVERTRELERRTVELRVATEVARDATTAESLEELLERAVNLVRDRFGFYHAGIFLLDERREYAVLRAATGEAGRRMLEQGHRLKVGEVGIVGYVTGTGKPRIALDVGADAVHFKNPLLPETRSELALPLRVEDRILGALDVQSTEEAAFDEEDVAILQTMADQLAVAIERLNRTAEIRAEHARLEAILRSTADGIIVANRAGLVLHINPVVQRWLTQTLSPQEAEQLWEAVRKLATLASEHPRTVLELKGLDLELSAAPVVGKGLKEQVVVSIHDVTHLKALDRMKSRFITNISHELRTPVTTIKLYAYLMQQQPDRWQEYIGPLSEEAERQAALVEDILQISRIDAGRLELNPEPTELNELTQPVMEGYRAQAEGKGLELIYRPAEPGPMALVDPWRMEQVLSRLLKNAVLYTFEGGRVEVTTGREEAEGRAWATVRVSDTGMGIPEEELPYIFDRFFRGAEPRRMQISGTGLGLSIVKEIVELHGGRVTVESEAGKGSTFTVWLPLAGETAAG